MPHYATDVKAVLQQSMEGLALHLDLACVVSCDLCCCTQAVVWAFVPKLPRETPLIAEANQYNSLADTDALLAWVAHPVALRIAANVSLVSEQHKGQQIPARDSAELLKKWTPHSNMQSYISHTPVRPIR